MDFFNNLDFNTKGYALNEVLPNDHGAKKLQFLFRPTQVETNIDVNYSDEAVLGMSHSYDVYSHTSSQEITFELYWNAMMAMKEKGRFYAKGARSTGPEGGATQLQHFGEKFEDARRWFEALTVPPEATPGAIGGTAPPSAVLVLPGIFAGRVRLRNVRFTFEECDARGNIKALRAAVSFREAPRTRFTMEEIYEVGSFRM